MLQNLTHGQSTDDDFQTDDLLRNRMVCQIRIESEARELTLQYMHQ